MMRLGFLMVAVSVLLISGCGDDGVRQNVKGAVTFKGQPIPFGKIAFRPDRERGGTGPAGFANIVNGEYNTSDSGKGSITGPVVVIIEGLVSDQPMASPLFDTYKTTSDVTKELKTLDFEVPDELAVDVVEAPSR